MLKKGLQITTLLVLFLFHHLLKAQVPVGYPDNYQAIINAAKKEGNLIIYSTTDAKLVDPLIKDFQVLYPEVKINYNDLNSGELVKRFNKEQTTQNGSSDFVWTSAMDSGLDLAIAYAAEYTSPELKSIPSWANYKLKVYGTTFEPVVIVYSKRNLKSSLLPKNLDDLGRLVLENPGQFRNRITTYNIEKSGVGIMLAAQDNVQNPRYFETIQKIGTSQLNLQSSIGTMLDRVSKGQSIVAYNVFASYAETQARKDPSIGIIYPDDYTLIMSRVSFINQKAKNPNAARLWLDYLLSERGQTILANKSGLGSIRSDIEGDNDVTGISKRIPGKIAPIPITNYILSFLGTYKRIAFIKQWKHAIGAD